MVVFGCDPCGISCVIATYLCLIYGYYVIIGVIIIPLMNETLWGTLHGLLFTFLFTLCIFSHLKATFSNPGILPLSRTPLDFSDLHANTENNVEGYTVCSKCEIYRPSDAHHCKVCKRCVRKRHHHCQWINNCVGELNQKYFLQFVFYIAILSIYSISFVMFSLIRYEDTSEASKISPTRLYHSVFLIVESLIFGLFVFAIICEQVTSIYANNAKSSSSPPPPRQQQHQQLSLYYSFKLVFKSNNPILWLLPCEFSSILNRNSRNNNSQSLENHYTV